VLLLTSLTDPIDIVRALESGADSFLSKPCDPEQLIARVNELLESWRLRSAADQVGGESDVLLGGKRYRTPSGKEQILALLVSTFEEIARKNTELIAARDALAAKHDELLRVEQQKEELSALVVHDLKSPAAGIMMAAQSRLRMPLPDAERTLWGLVYTSAEVINRMVRNLLDISSSADGVFAPRPARVDVAKLVQDVERLMTPAATSLRHHLAVTLAHDLPALHADSELLRRVLQNLVDNALRHSPPGDPIRIEVDVVADSVRFRVRDRGPGIAPGLRERIFDKYARVAASSGDGGSFGKGLGLAFCRMAVEAHRGTIGVEDDTPSGSVFTVTIPIAPASR
jgi:signal transduction histidine kinase